MKSKKTNYLLLIFLPLIIFLCFGLWAVNKSPLSDVIIDSTTGVFDLREFDFHNHFALTERIVEYIPDELLTPEEFELRDDVQSGKVPDGTEICTMRIRLLVPDGIHYGIAGYAPNYASSVYVNGEWIYDQGKPALTLEDEQSSEAYRLISAQPVDGVIEIVVQTSGFANVDPSSGIGFFVGEYELSRIYYTRVITQDVIVMSAYIFVALFSLLLFFVLPSYKATGWLSLLSLVWAIRVGLKSKKILLTLFPNHTWNFVFKTEITTSPLTILLLALVLHSVFTGALPRWLRAVIIGGSALMALAVAVLPWPTFLGHSSWSNPPIYWTLAVMLGFILFSMWRTKTRPTLSQIIILIGMGLVVFAFIWDENYYGFFSSVRILFTVPFALTQPMMLVFTVFMLVATLLETMRKTTQREVQLAEKVKMQGTELLQSRINIMLSQIQPHFLYNTLGAIDKLYFENTEEGHNAIVKFSNYLRGNMDSLTKKVRIPFAEELTHIKQYLSLEELRFGKKLQVIYDIQTDDFTLPVLTLQPIVENAVRHGVTKKPGGGSVTIKAEETEHSYIIEVADDGVGFNPDESLNDERSHIGIANVRERLSSMCGGSLTIRSEPGNGTTAVIEIPKGGTSQ